MDVYSLYTYSSKNVWYKNGFGHLPLSKTQLLQLLIKALNEHLSFYSFTVVALNLFDQEINIWWTTYVDIFLLSLLWYVKLFFHSSTMWMFSVSWYHLSAQHHLRSESLWFLLMLMYALLYIPNPSSGDPLDPSGCPLDILRISFGNPLDIV